MGRAAYTGGPLPELAFVLTLVSDEDAYSEISDATLAIDPKRGAPNGFPSGPVVASGAISSFEGGRIVEDAEVDDPCGKV